MGFSFDGISSSDMKIKARLTAWQVLPAVRNNTLTISGKPGVADFGCVSRERMLTISCNVYPQKSFKDLVDVLDKVAAWLDPTKGSKHLIFDEIPGRYFEARLNEQVDCNRILRTAGSFDLVFICPDPYAYAENDEAFTIKKAGDSKITRTVGNTESNPVFYLKGVISSGGSTYISIITNDIEMKVVGPLAEEETLVIDTALMTAKVIDKDGSTIRNGLPSLQALEFPTLVNGDNEVSIFINGDADFKELKIQAKSRWR